jgi:tetratricopeptide (TPR) repeat protein
MNSTFVNRNKELNKLKQVLKYDGKESPVLVFTGIGGIGKTAIRIAFEEQVLKQNAPYAVLDYDSNPNLRSTESTLRAIRRQLERFKVKTPVFDYLYARYFELSTGLKFSAQNYPPELENVISILKGIPFVGSVTTILYGLSGLGINVKERVRHKEWLYRLREIEPNELLSILPEVLAEDLEANMTSGDSQFLNSRITLMFDAYEFIKEFNLDDTLQRKLLLLTPHLMRVIFTRDQLSWEYKYPDVWKGKILHFPPLGNLTRDDSFLYLNSKNIKDPELNEYIFKLTGGYPLHLELCGDIYKGIKETTNKEPVVKDYEGTDKAEDLTEELINRLLRQLKDDEKDLMGLASYPRWVSEEVLEVLSSVPESVPRIFKKFKELSMFYPHPEIPEAFIIRKEVRECLIRQQRKKRLWKERHGKLANYHKGRWKETQSIHNLREFIYHSFLEDAEKGIKLFEEYYWRFLKKYSFGKAAGILESVPYEFLNDEQKRKTDYAKVSLLTSNIKSKQNLNKAKEILENLINSETDNECLGEYYFSLGDLLCVLGEWEKALFYSKKSLEIRLKIYGEENPDVANTYSNISVILREQGEYDKALEYSKKSLAIRLKLFEQDHPDVASSYQNTGNVHYKLGNFEKALEYYKKGLAIRLNVFGNDHPEVAKSYNTIGIINRKLGNYKRALEYYGKSLFIRRNVYGEEHPDVAGSYHNMGIIHRELGDYDKALEEDRKSLDIRLKIYGEEHPYVADSYNDIGIIHSIRNKHKKALEYYLKSLDIRLKIYGEEHPHIADSYNNIGSVYYKQGDYNRAIDYYKKSLAIRLKNFGDEHTDIANSFDNIGEVYRDQGQYEKALNYYKKCLDIRLKNFGEEHPMTADSNYDIAICLWALKKEEEALSKIRKSIDINYQLQLWREAKKGLDTLADWLKYLERDKEAGEAHKKALEIKDNFLS